MVKTKNSKRPSKTWLFAVLVIAAIGTGGWYVGQRNQNANNNSRQANDITSISQLPSQPQQADLSEGGKYLAIKEWGVRLPLDESIADAKYSIIDDSSIQLSTLNLQKIGGCEAGNIIALERAKHGESLNGQVIDENAGTNSNFIKAGDHYYLFTSAQLSCARESDAKGKAQLSTIKESFFKAVKSLQAY